MSDFDWQFVEQMQSKYQCIAAISPSCPCSIVLQPMLMYLCSSVPGSMTECSIESALCQSAGQWCQEQVQHFSGQISAVEGSPYKPGNRINEIYLKLLILWSSKVGSS